MNDIKIISTADWHADSDPKKQEKLKTSLAQMLDYVKNNKVNAIVHSGDIWEKKQSYADRSGVPVVVNYLKAMSHHVDFIFITKGNNSHDEVGSVTLLNQLEPNIYAYEYPVVLAVALDEYGAPYLVDLMRESLPVDNLDVNDIAQYIVSLVPYPTKASFITNDSIDNNNTDFIEKFEQVFELIADRTAGFNCPKVLAFHGNVVGSRLSSGQTLVSQDIMVAPNSLKKAKHDYYALGHIHMRQEVAPNMVYSGSIYNKSWGETEQKSFEVIEFEGVGAIQGYNSEQVMFDSAKPMIKIEAEFVDGEFVFEINPPAMEGNSEVRFRYTVKENEKALITDAKLDELKRVFGDDVKIESNVLPDERESRSEQIMNCSSLLDEVEEYAKVVEFEITESMKEKVYSISGEVLNETT